MKEFLLCPLSRFKKCKKEKCACYLLAENGNGECSFKSIGHIDFTLAAIGSVLSEEKRQGGKHD